jgi:phosphoglucan,water dikinase
VEQVTAETGGQKAFGLRRLAELSSDAAAGFLVPSALVIPFGVMEQVLSSNKELREEYSTTAKKLDAIPAEQIQPVIDRLGKLFDQLNLPDEITSTVARNFREDDRLMVRSSANCEDLEDFAGAGLYESIPNVPPAEVASAVRRVWSSLWTSRAVLSRRQAGIAHEKAQMAVIIQQMLAPDYSFILHTVNPLSHNADEVYSELAVGLGETLASAASQGTPYRLLCNKKSGEVQTLAFANFSHAFQADSKGGVSRKLLDYSRLPLSCYSEPRIALGRQLAAIGARVENEFEKPQDIEGAIVGNKIYLVQSRPQQGL